MLPDILAARSATIPDALALVVDGAGGLTFRQWDERSTAFARGLWASGLTPRARLGLLFDNTRLDDYAVAYFGALKAGLAAVPLSRHSPPADLDEIVRGADLAAVVHPGDRRPPDLAAPLLSFPEIGADHDPAPLSASGHVVRPDDVAEILYTSGTTGERKGVVADHSNVAVGWGEDDERGATATDRDERYFLHAMPFGTNAGQVTLRGALHWPPTTLVLPEFDELRFCELVEQHRVTSVLLVPAMATWLLNSGDHERFDLTSVRTVVVTAAALAPAELTRLDAMFARAEVHNSYTSTEAWPARTGMRYDPQRPLALGRPLEGGRVKVTDDDGRPAVTGGTGDIWLRAPRGVAPRHYLDEPETPDVFDGDWVRTGDVGHLDEDGYLFLTGRRAELVDVGGFNVSELEVEAVLHEHDAVREAAVVGLPHDVLGHTIAAAVVVNGADGASAVRPAQLRAFAAERLPPHKVPTRIALVDSLPRNDALKVRKDEVERLLLRMPVGRAVPVAPRNRLEETLARLWGAALGGDHVGITDDFFAGGGNSLVAQELLAGIRRATGVRLTLRELFDAPTVAGAALTIRRRREEAVPEHRGEPRIRRLVRQREGAAPVSGS